MLLLLICVVTVGLGFLWQMGYQFLHLRSFLSRARYLSIYRYQISLERKFWRIHRHDKTIEFSVTCSYPKLLKLFPTRFSVDLFDCECKDESEPVVVTGYSDFRFDLPVLPSWFYSFLRKLASTLRPEIVIAAFESSYRYKSCDGDYVYLASKMVDSKFSVAQRTITCSRGEAGLSRSGFLEGAKNEVVRFNAIGNMVLHIKALDELDVVCEAVDAHVHGLDDIPSLIRHFAASEGPRPVRQAPSNLRLKLALSVRSKITSTAYFGNGACSVVSCMDMGPSAARQTTAGLYASVLMDPISLSVFDVSVHNFSKSTSSIGAGGSIRQLSTQLLVHQICLAHVGLTNSSIIGDMSMGSWSASARTQAVTLSLFDAYGVDHLVVAKSISMMASPEKGFSFLMNLLEIDASARMMNKVVRAYLKLMNLMDGVGTPTPPPLTPSRQSSTPPVVGSSLLVVGDVNYRLMQMKYLNSLTAPVTPALSVSKPMTRSNSSQSALSESSSSGSSGGARMRSENNLKNWKSMERVMNEGGKILVSLSIEKLQVRDKTLLTVNTNRLKVSSKISSVGSPFTNICLDGFAVNDNVVASGGLRIWIDGSIASETSRVFCLIPPISIRFDPKFAALVETYLLEIVEVVKLLNGKPTSQAPASETTRFIEFLQISSLQLELHAKEMLGVLALDKAMINLTRSSVYKSNGLMDAIDSLMSQYKEEVVGQWLSLLMRLDVSIGRPVSTARKIIGGITDLFSRGDGDRDSRNNSPGL